MAEKPVEVVEAEVIHVFIENVEPGAVAHDPVEARDFNVDQATMAVCSSDQVQESLRVRDVLEHVPKNDGIDTGLDGRPEMALFNVGGIALVGIVDPACA